MRGNSLGEGTIIRIGNNSTGKNTKSNINEQRATEIELMWEEATR